MEDLLQARIKRLHGDFLDPDGEYEIVSSLSSRAGNSIPQNDENVVVLHNGNNIDDVEIVPSSVVTIGKTSPESMEPLFYLHSFWMWVTVSVFIWLSWKWAASDATKHNIWPSGEADKRRKENTEAEEITRKTTTTTTTASLTCTRQSVTSKRCPDEARNLGLHFEEVKDDNEYAPCSDGTKEATMNAPQDTLSYDINTTEFKLDSTSQTVVEQRETLFDVSATDVTACQDHQLSVSSQQGVRQRKQPPSTSISTSPPDLVEESSPATLMPLLSRSCTTTPVKNGPPSVPNVKRASSAPSLPASNPNYISTTALHHSASVYMNFGADTAASQMSLFESSSMEQTPQKLAQEFCKNLQIIEEVLAQSGTKIDRSRAAADLAMVHQTAQVKQQQQYREQQHTEYHARLQSSAIRTEKYDRYLQQLSKLRDDCLQSVTEAISYSVLACVLLEGARHAAAVLESLDYFSMDHFGGLVLQMACGCRHDWLVEEDGLQDTPSNTSYISLLSSFFFSTMSQSIAESTNNSLASLLGFASYISCALCYILLCATMTMFHSVLKKLHCPALVHQLLNAAVIALYLAQNPSAWVVVTRNLEVYTVWIVLQGMISFLSFLLVMALYVRFRNQLLLIQQNGCTEIPETSKRQNVGRMLAQLEDLRWILGIVPPLLMGGLVLATTDNR